LTYPSQTLFYTFPIELSGTIKFYCCKPYPHIIRQIILVKELIHVTDPLTKDPWVKLTFKSWGFYLDMSYDLIIRVIVVVVTLIVVVLAVPRVKWPLTIIVEMLTIVRVINVIVTLMVVMLVFLLGTACWRFLRLSLEYSLSLDCFTCKFSMDSTLLERLFIWVDILFILARISRNFSWISLRILLMFESMVTMSSRWPLC